MIQRPRDRIRERTSCHDGSRRHSYRFVLLHQRPFLGRQSRTGSDHTPSVHVSGPTQNERRGVRWWRRHGQGQGGKGRPVRKWEGVGSGRAGSPPSRPSSVMSTSGRHTSFPTYPLDSDQDRQDRHPGTSSGHPVEPGVKEVGVLLQT